MLYNKIMEFKRQLSPFKIMWTLQSDHMKNEQLAVLTDSHEMISTLTCNGECVAVKVGMHSCDIRASESDWHRGWQSMLNKEESLKLEEFIM